MVFGSYKMFIKIFSIPLEIKKTFVWNIFIKKIENAKMNFLSKRVILKIMRISLICN